MRRALAVGMVVGVLVVGAVAAYLLFGPAGANETRLTGTLFVSDAGQSHGGFEYAASYNVTVSVVGGRGTMTAVLQTGLGDVLARHEYAITEFRMTSDALTMAVDGHDVVLPWTPEETVWNHSYDNHYIASWGSTAPSEEIRGSIGPAVFPGVPSTYYVELRVA